MQKFHENLTYGELCGNDVECPVCWKVNQFEAILLEPMRYLLDGEGEHTWEQYQTSRQPYLLELTCLACGFELLKRTAREALSIEEDHRRD